MAGGFTTNFVIADAVSCHIYTHIRRGFVRACAGNLFKHGIEYRKDLHIPVVVYRRFVISIQMEGVDHVDIIKVGRCCFISQVYRVLQWNIPDGEGLKLGVAGGNPSLMFMVELGKAGGHFPASGSRSRDHH